MDTNAAKFRNLKPEISSGGVHSLSFAGSSNLRKYQTRNPVVQHLIRRFFRMLLKEITKLEPATILDLGCGEGIVAGAILKEMPSIAYRGCDNNRGAIDEARRRNSTGEFERRDLFDLQPERQRPDLVLCLEVMEHIEETDKLLRQFARLAGKHVLVSVPWEPFFRLGNLCRGRHVGQLGNHPEHVHCFDRTSLRRALSRHFSNVRVEPSFPWLFGICSVPSK